MIDRRRTAGIVTGRAGACAGALGLAILLALACAGCGAAVMPPIEGSSGRYAHAQALMDRGEYLGASETLKSYIEGNAGSAEVDLAIYALGACYIKMKEYAQAEIQLDRLLRDYPESDSIAAASFSLGEAYMGQSRMEDFDQEFTLKALQQWERYLREFPDHWRHADATKRIADARARLARKLVKTGQLYISLKQPFAARAYFERVSQQFDDTPVVGEALIGMAQVDAMIGKRDEALAALKELEARFAGQPLGSQAAQARHRIEKMKHGQLYIQRTHIIPDQPQ